jgi:hypothetical protein
VTDISSAVRQLVLERDGYACVSCGCGIRGPLGYSIQHRTPRGMGGSRMPWVNLPANLITVCGSATTGCHAWMESHRVRAREWGYLSYRINDPATIPVLTSVGWVLFDNDGCKSYVDNPDGYDHSRTSPEIDAYIRGARDMRAGATTTTGA